MSPHIVRIEDAGPARKARRLVFDDGSEPRITSAAVVKALTLQEGADLPLSALEAALCAEEATLAKERALQLLGYRERSSAELRQKLRDSGYSLGLANQLVARFEELGLVDDARFAGMWVRSRQAAGYGDRRIARELSQRGISPELASSALGAQSANGGQLERARAALRGRVAADGKERERLLRRLVTKGFSLAIAKSAIDSAGKDASAEL